MPFAKIRYTVDDGIATIELTDPPANTYSYEMMREIDAAVLDARMDSAVHVIVVRGAGEKFFCAGANIGMLKDADPEFIAIGSRDELRRRPRARAGAATAAVRVERRRGRHCREPREAQPRFSGT